MLSSINQNHYVNVLITGPDEPTGTSIPSMLLNYLGSDIDWGFQTEPERFACLGQPEKRCRWPRGKVLGGTSTINGMMYIRGNPSDYDDWKKAGNPGWGWEDVLPFFKKSEDNQNLNDVDPTYHGKGGLLPVSYFPYAPPMANAILRSGEELGKFHILSSVDIIDDIYV